MKPTTRQECILAEERGELTDWERQEAERNVADYAKRENLSLSEDELARHLELAAKLYIGREKDFFCLDCDVDIRTIGETIELTDRACHNHGFGQQGPGMLCIDCLEKRIGRRLVREDFMIVERDAPWAWIPLTGASPKLLDRLAHSVPEMVPCTASTTIYLSGDRSDEEMLRAIIQAIDGTVINLSNGRSVRIRPCRAPHYEPGKGTKAWVSADYLDLESKRKAHEEADQRLRDQWSAA
jgi:hypothetical protein